MKQIKDVQSCRCHKHDFRSMDSECPKCREDEKWHVMLHEVSKKIELPKTKNPIKITKSHVIELSLFGTVFLQTHLFGIQSEWAWYVQFVSIIGFITYNYHKGLFGYTVGNIGLLMYTVISYVHWLNL